jgi:DNA-binding NarL/FixJ family response regulator
MPVNTINFEPETFKYPNHLPNKPQATFLGVASNSPTFIIIDDQPLEALGLKAMLREIHQDASIFTAHSYESGDDLITEKLIDGRIDLILVYIDLKSDSYLAAIEQLHQKYPYICIAVAAPHSLPITPSYSNLVLKCLEAGAVGYLPKGSSIEVIQSAVKSVMRGNLYIPREIMKAADAIQVEPDEAFTPSPQLTHQSPAQPFSGLVSLSSRQYLQSLGNGPQSAQIRPIKAGAPIPKNTRPTITGYEIGLTGRQVDVLDLILLGLSNKRICRELDLAEGTVKVHVSAVLRALGARTRTEAVVTASNLGLASRIIGKSDQ